MPMMRFRLQNASSVLGRGFFGLCRPGMSQLLDSHRLKRNGRQVQVFADPAGYRSSWCLICREVRYSTSTAGSQMRPDAIVLFWPVTLMTMLAVGDGERGRRQALRLCFDQKYEGVVGLLLAPMRRITAPMII